MRADAASWAPLLDAIGLLWSPRPVRLRFWLGASLARPFVMPPVSGLRSRDEAVRMAEAMAAEACGLEGESQVWLDRWSPDRACLAVAVERRVVDDLHALGDRIGCRVAAIVPWWNAVLSHRLGVGEPPGVLCVQEADGVTVLGLGADGVSFAQSQGVAPAPERLWAQLLRLAVSQGIDKGRIARALFVDGANDGDRALPVGAVRWLEADA